jgi:type II protein arginine methyltransferase
LTRTRLDGRVADVIVSELLGSFGDNELSPECLQPLWTHADPCCTPDTISIPCRYTAHLAPISSSHLHHQTRLHAYYPLETASEGVVGRQAAMETPYVVRPYRASQMHAELDCWSFAHPSSTLDSGHRSVVLDFDLHATPSAANGSGYGPVRPEVAALTATHTTTPPLATCHTTIHGFVGTFTAVLYEAQGTNNQDTVLLSTAPSQYSTGMFSWFPLWFPLVTPLVVPAGCIVRALWWRRVDPRQGKVWYEWAASVVDKDTTTTMTTTPIHNPQGRSYCVSMT